MHSFYCTITFWALKPFFGRNIKFVLQRNFQLQAVKARDAIHGFVCTPTAIKLHAFNYTAITFDSVGLQSLKNIIQLKLDNKCTNIFQNIKANLMNILLKCQK